MNHTKITGSHGSQLEFKAYSDDWYFYALYANGVCCTIGLILSVYFILCKSPQNMKEYKYFLLNISITSFIFDSYTSLLWTPVPLFPALAICSHGPLGMLGPFAGGTVGLAIYLALCTMCSISVIWAFLYRLALITNKDDYIKSKTAIMLMVLFQLFYETPTVVLHFILNMRRSEHIAAAVAEYPNIAEYILPESNPCSASSFNVSSITWMFMLSMCTEFGLPIPVAFLLIYLCNRALDRQKGHMSTKTIKMHRSFLKSLILQMSVPMLALFLPYTFGTILLLLKVEDVQWYYQINYLIGHFHSTLNTIMLIASVESYRNAFFSMLKKLTGNVFSKSTNSQVESKSSTAASS